MFTRRTLPHQQQQPQRDRVAQLQQQSGSSEFQYRACSRNPAGQLGSQERPRDNGSQQR